VTQDTPARREVLFLQGMASRFFAELGSALLGRGHGVHRVNFNAGDRLFWPLPNAVDFRGRPDGWARFLHRLIHTRGITDIVLFGDCRPLHRAAIEVARQLNLPVHVCEEGYIRPDWVVFERDGVNGNSTLPRDPDWYRAQAGALQPLDALPPITSSFRRRATEDLLYNLASMAFGFAYPHYRTHRPRHRLREYASWSRKVLATRARQRRSAQQLARLGLHSVYYLMPLQLECDTQIRMHSAFGSLRPMIAEAVQSFARHAPPDSCLVVKEHPLDDGAIRWRGIVRDVAAEHGVGDRVLHLETGDIGSLVAGAAGLVTVNSTTGTLALSQGVPVITLGQAVYDIPGLTFQGPLDRFWTGAPPPDAELYAAFRRTLAQLCLLPGSFFSQSGIDLLVRHAVERLEATELTAPARLVAPELELALVEGSATAVPLPVASF
jgi:capsular polysaccharide export protein